MYRKLDEESEEAAQARGVVERKRGGARRGGLGRDEEYDGEAERERAGCRCRYGDGDGERRRRKEVDTLAAAMVAVTPSGEEKTMGVRRMGWAHQNHATRERYF